MAGQTVGAAYGISVTFTDSGFTAEMTDINLSGFSRDAIDTTHQGSGTPGPGQIGNRTYMPSDLVDAGEMSMDLHFNPDTVPPIHGTRETVQITWPKAKADGRAATWSFPGFLTGFSVGAPLGDKMTASATVKIAGAVVVDTAKDASGAEL